MSAEANAVWKDGLFTGRGTVSSPSRILNKAPYVFGSFAAEVPSSSPCEMLAAAIASCMATMVAVEMAKAGIKPSTVDTHAVLTVENPAGQWRITGAHLDITARTTEAGPRGFEEAVEAARHSCPISNLLKIELQCKSKLISATAFVPV